MVLVWLSITGYLLLNVIQKCLLPCQPSLPPVTQVSLSYYPRRSSWGYTAQHIGFRAQFPYFLLEFSFLLGQLFQDEHFGIYLFPVSFLYPFDWRGSLCCSCSLLQWSSVLSPSTYLCAERSVCFQTVTRDVHIEIMCLTLVKLPNIPLHYCTDLPLLFTQECLEYLTPAII